MGGTVEGSVNWRVLSLWACHGTCEWMEVRNVLARHVQYFFPEHVGQCCRPGAGKNIPLDYLAPLLVPLRASLGSMENGKGDGGSGWAQTWT